MSRDDPRNWITAGIMAALILIGAATLAYAEPQLPPGVTCIDIRTKVHEHGYAKAVLWARAKGYLWAQIYEAKKYLHWSG